MSDKEIIEFEKEYGKSENGNFYICDTIGIPHPYCIGSRHVTHAADHFGGMLGQDAIESAEKQGIRCCTKGCNLSYAEHEQALLVACKEELQIDGKTNPELNKWLLTVKNKIGPTGKYAGFAFISYKENTS